MKVKFLALACAATLITSPLAQAEEFVGEAIFPWVAVGQSHMISDARPYFVGYFTGITLFEDDAGPLHNAMIICPGYNDIGISAAGYCTMTTAVGDKVYLQWSCDAVEPPAGILAACNGTTTITGGTGMFEGATGGNDLFAHVIGVNPDGTTLGYTDLKNYVLSY